MELGEPTTLPVVLPVVGLTIQRPGTYIFVLRLDKLKLAQIEDSRHASADRPATRVHASRESSDRRRRLTSCPSRDRSEVMRGFQGRRRNRLG